MRERNDISSNSHGTYSQYTNLDVLHVCSTVLVCTRSAFYDIFIHVSKFKMTLAKSPLTHPLLLLFIAPFHGSLDLAV
jgi:hypothetical protein